MPPELRPTVTIGMPVFNAESTIRSALDSLLGQTYGDFELVISDNASSDNTEAICREYKAHDQRIRYVRQSRNLSAAMNFRSVLFEAHTPFFMWAAGDDLWAPTFIERTLTFLEAHPDYVCCQGRVLLTINGRPSRYSDGTYPLSGDWHSNVARFFMNANDNSRIYGMFRTPALQAVFPIRTFHALDWALSAATLKFGRHAELCEVLMIRDATDVNNYVRQLHSEHKFILWRTFPILFMTFYCLRHRFIPISIRTFRVLVRLNLYMAFFYSRIGRRYRETGSLPHAVFGHFSRILGRSNKYQTSVCSTIVPSTHHDRPPDPPPLVRNWLMPASLAGKPAQRSIIIIASPSVDFTLASIDSIARTQNDIPLEIIICDAGPGDVTSVLWKAADNIKCIRCDSTLTYDAAADLAVQQATTQNIAFFNQKISADASAVR
jgi:glycosyltransferase involved in cell wall biosynthesis